MKVGHTSVSHMAEMICDWLILWQHALPGL